MLLKSFTFRLVLMCLAGLFPVLGYSSNVLAADLGVVAGKVTGQRSKTSMCDVNVKIVDGKGKLVKIVKSGRDGTYIASNVPVGQYKVKAGKVSKKKILVVKAPPVTRVDFQIPEKGYYAFTGTTWVWIGIAALAIGGLTWAVVEATDGSSSKGSAPTSP